MTGGGLLARLGVHRWPVTVGGACAALLVVGGVVGAVQGVGEDEPAPTTTSSTSVEVDASAPPPSFGGPPPAEVVRFGMVGLEHLDPAFVLPSDQSAMIAVDLLFDGLTALGPDGAPVPALASSWEPDESLRVWTFHLRDGATFADGSPVTARDVQASLDRLAALGNISLGGVRLDVIDGYPEVADGTAGSLSGVAVVDDATLRIVTTESYAPLPELLSSPLYGVVPAGVVAADEVGFDRAPVGSGPYALAAREGAVVRLAAREGAGAVPAPEADLIAYPDAAAAYGAFEAGELDWSVVPAGLLDEAVAAHGGEAVVPFGVELLYGFNLDHPTFEDVKMRSAVAKAIDRQALLDTVLESAEALDGSVPPGVPGAVGDACAALCSFDPGVAAALVAQAFPSGEVPTVELDVYDDPVESAVAAVVAANLEAVGIPVEVVTSPFEEYQQFVADGGSQLFTYGWVGVAVEPDAYVGPMFLSDSPDNVTGFEDGVVDLAVRTARAEPDRAARLALYGDIDRQVMLGVPVVPVASYVTAAVVGERVSGYEGRTDGTFVLGSMQVTGGS